MDQIPMKDMGRFVGAAMQGAAAAIRRCAPGIAGIIGAIEPEAGLFVLERDERAAGDGDLRA